MNSCTGRLYPYEYGQEFFLFPFYLLSFLVCTQVSMAVLPLLPPPYSFHLFNTSYFTRPFSQDPSLCYRSLSTDLSSSLWCLSQAPSPDSSRPQLLHRQDVALLQQLHFARSQQHVLGLLISVPSSFSRVATLYNWLSYFPP